jgi:hypothetical protein
MNAVNAQGSVMPEGPSFPTGPLLASLAVVADFGGILALILANVPLLLKASIVAIAAVIPIAAVFFHLGQKRGWKARGKKNASPSDGEAD